MYVGSDSHPHSSAKKIRALGHGFLSAKIIVIRTASHIGTKRRLLSGFILCGCIAISPYADAKPQRTSFRRAEKPRFVPRGAPEKTPDGFIRMYVTGIVKTDAGPAVVLQNKSKTTLFPIWIGSTEAHSIQLRLNRKRFSRPLTHDLLDSIMNQLGGRLTKIHVDDVKGETYVGTIFVRRKTGTTAFDARPSDSIALALGSRAPIFVKREVIQKVDEIRRRSSPKKETEERTHLPVGIQTL